MTVRTSPKRSAGVPTAHLAALYQGMGDEALRAMYVAITLDGRGDVEPDFIAPRLAAMEAEFTLRKLAVPVVP